MSHSASPEALFSCKRWYLQPPEHSGAALGKKPPRVFAAFAGTVKLAIKEAKKHADGIVATAHDVPDRCAAEALKGARIFVPRSSFPTPAQDEYYWVDLIGLQVINRQGVKLGRVKELLSTGPQTVLVIADAQPIEPGSTAKTIERMIPFVSAYVDTVNVAGSTITVDWQPDY